LGLAEAALLEVHDYHHSVASRLIKEIYGMFKGNIYEEMTERGFEDFSHRRRAGSTGGGYFANSPTIDCSISSHIEQYFDLVVPVLEAFVASEYPSSLTSKFFGALIMVTNVSTMEHFLCREGACER
jgi:hypothetical protein